MASDLSFAFVTGVKSLPDPYLVEISRRTKTTRACVSVFPKNNIIWCPREMTHLLFILLHDKLFHTKYRWICKRAFVHALSSGKAGSSKLEWEELALDAIVEAEVLSRFQRRQRRHTRQSNRIVKKVAAKCRDMRKARMLEEPHWQCSFRLHARRCFQELNHVLDQMHI